MSESDDLIQIEPMSIDQLAGSVVLFFGAIGSLLLVVWQSRCLCRCRIGCSDNCYIFDCAREPPPITDEETPTNQEQQVDEPIIPPNQDPAAPPVADEPNTGV